MRLAFTVENLSRAVGGLEEASRRAAALGPAMERLGQHHQRKAQRVLRGGERGIQARNPAGLAASISYLTEGNSLVVGSDKSYAASQQFGPPGGFYLPVKGRYLAIPVADNVRARENPRYDSPRDVPDGVFFRSSSGTLLFGIPDKRKGRAARSGRQRTGWSQFLKEKIESLHDGFRELLFVLVTKARGEAHYYVTHDEPDQKLWDRLSADWILRGRV